MNGQEYKESIKRKVKVNNGSYVKGNKNIKEIENCNTNYMLIQLVPVIGFIVSLVMIIMRKNFKTYFNISFLTGLYLYIPLFFVGLALYNDTTFLSFAFYTIMMGMVVHAWVFVLSEYSLITMRRHLLRGFDIETINGEALLTSEEEAFLIDTYSVKLLGFLKVPLFS